GAKYNPLIQDEQYWRLLTPIFLHIGFPHLLFNSMALYFIGPAVERIYGGFRFIFIFLLAGVMGSLASFAFTPNLSAGASGAIFGCFGALLFFGQKHRALFFQTMGKDILFFLGLNLMLGFIFPGIDNFGHIGGLLGGYLAATTVGIPKEKYAIIVRMVFILALIIIMAAMFTVGMV
ncbi:MAG: rhomboid family intramembrane serine protease, partial [Bacilli bacterium]